jgi:hypothetical protein
MPGFKRIAFICATTLILAGCGKGGGGGGPQPAQKKEPPSQGAVQTVELDLKEDNTWKVKLKGDPNEQDPKTAKTKLEPEVGPTMFEVTIKPGTAATFTATDPLSVWEGTGAGGAKAAAPAQWGVNSTQIIGPFLKNGGKTLVFYDLNYGSAVTLNYAVRFKENGIPPVDPIIENGGGQWQ